MTPFIVFRIFPSSVNNNENKANIDGKVVHTRGPLIVLFEMAKNKENKKIIKKKREREKLQLRDMLTYNACGGLGRILGYRENTYYTVVFNSLNIDIEMTE